MQQKRETSTFINTKEMRDVMAAGLLNTNKTTRTQ